MTAKYKNNSAITLIIWCSSFLSLVVILAWEFGWVSTDVPQAKISNGQTKQIAEKDKMKLTDEITKAEEIKFKQGKNKKTASEISNEEIEKRLLAKANPQSATAKKESVKKKPVKAKVANNKPASKKSVPIKPLKPVEKKIVLAKAEKISKEPAILKPAKAKPISQVANKQNSTSNKEPQKTQLISFEQTASINPPKIELDNNTAGNNIVFPEDSSSNEILNLDDDTFTRKENLPAEIVEIDQLLKKGKYIAAHRKLSSYFFRRPELREFVLPRIETNAHRIYFSPQPHFMKPYLVKPGEHLSQIAKKYHVPWQYLAKLNQIEPKRIQPDQQLKVIKGPFSALVDLGEYTVSIHAHGYFVCQYPVGVGKDNSTPIGKFAVLNKVANPQYTNPQGTVVEADDPKNPLGEHWIDLGNSYGIHGTIDPGSIGKNESRGCIRMRNEDVEEVYNLLTIESEVVIRR